MVSIQLDIRLLCGEALFLCALYMCSRRYLGCVSLREQYRIIRSYIFNEKDHTDKNETLYPSEFITCNPSGTSRIHNVKIVKPYPWLCDLKSVDTQAWIAAERKCTSEQLCRGNYSVFASKIQESMHKFESYKIVHAPLHRGRKYFYFKKAANSLQASLYYANDIRAEGMIALDTSLLCKQGMILRGTWISNDGEKIAYGISNSVTDKIMTLFVRTTTTCEDSEVDVLHGCTAELTSVSWLEGSSGFFYTCNCESRTYSFNGESSHLSSSEGVSSDSKPLDQPDHKRAAVGVIVQRVCFHRLGTSQINDLVVYEDDNELLDSADLHFSPMVSSDGHYLLLEVFNRFHDSLPLSEQPIDNDLGSACPGNSIYYLDLTLFDGLRVDTLGPVVKIIDCFDYRFEYISNIEEDFWFRTNYKAPRFRVVRIGFPEFDQNILRQRLSEGDAPRHGECFNLEQHLENTWKHCSQEWIAQHKSGGVLQSAGIAAHTVLVLKFFCNACHEVVLYDLSNGADPTVPVGGASGVPSAGSAGSSGYTAFSQQKYEIASLPHPLYGTVSDIHCHFSSFDVFYEFTGFSDPGSVYRAIIHRDPYTGHIEISFDQLCSASIPGIDLNQFETKQEMYVNRKDGTMVPMFVFGRRDTLDTKRHSCIVNAFGGFGVSTLPAFSLPILLHAALFDGVYCVANVRGGGELGRQWHKAGSGRNKLVAVQDLISATDHLISSGYTSRPQVSVMCGTHGALLAAACVAQQPSLFAACVFEDPILDLIDCLPVQPIVDSTLSETEQPGHNKAATATDTVAAHEMNTVWRDELGSAQESKDECVRLLAMSPLHLIDEVKSRLYPALLVHTNFDSLVGPGQSFQYVAELQRLAMSSRYSSSASGDKTQGQGQKLVLLSTDLVEDQAARLPKHSGSDHCLRERDAVAVKFARFLSFLAEHTKAQLKDDIIS